MLAYDSPLSDDIKWFPYASISLVMEVRGIPGSPSTAGDPPRSSSVPCGRGRRDILWGVTLPVGWVVFAIERTGLVADGRRLLTHRPTVDRRCQSPCQPGNSCRHGWVTGPRWSSRRCRSSIHSLTGSVSPFTVSPSKREKRKAEPPPTLVDVLLVKMIRLMRAGRLNSVRSPGASWLFGLSGAPDGDRVAGDRDAVDPAPCRSHPLAQATK